MMYHNKFKYLTVPQHGTEKSSTRQRKILAHTYRVKNIVSYNHGHNILRFFDVLPNFPFTTIETKHDYLLIINMVYTTCRRSC